MLYPKLFTTLKNYSREQFFSDFVAGVIVGIVALPLAIAFAIASGVTPEKGLITAIVAGFIISAIGGSRVQIGGPTGAFVVIVYGIVQKYGMDGLLTATLMAGILIMIMGLARLGNVIKFIPHPLTVGFTSGIAVIIFSSQVKDFLGLQMGKVPADFLEKWRGYAESIHSFNPWAFVLAISTVVIISFWPRVSRKIPGSVIALVLASVVVRIFHLPVETIGSRFGDLPQTLPRPHFPSINFASFHELVRPAFTIALLGSIESLLSAVVSDGMIGAKHRSNMELIAQGIANIASSVFGGIPATGAIARTATNVKNGGRTPVAGMVHSLTLLAILLFAGKWAKLIPMACLAGILTVVSYHMSEWRSFVGLLRGPRGDISVLLITFLLTILVDLTVAIEIGMVLAAFLFMHRMASVTKVSLVSREVSDDAESEGMLTTSRIQTPKGVEIYEIDGPLFFGVSHEFEEAMRVIENKPKVRILRLKEVPVIDATGLHALGQFHQKCKHAGIHLLICGFEAQPLAMIKQSGLYETIGKENFFGDIHLALAAAINLLPDEQ